MGAGEGHDMLDESVKRFDISAKAGGDSVRTPADFRLMLQTLLKERFHLSSHREQREMPVYLLMVDKNGSRLKPAAPDAPGFLRMSGGGRITGSGATMAQLTAWFSNSNGVERPTVDRTGLTGRYDFTLDWAGPGKDDGPSVFTAFSEQLGLKLEAARAPVEVLVIDSAEMPEEN